MLISSLPTAAGSARQPDGRGADNHLRRPRRRTEANSMSPLASEVAARRW